MSRRTVSRAVLEGGVAANMQLGYEMQHTRSLTASGDSTSHRKQNYEAHHIALRAPDYTSDSLAVSTATTPSIRFVGIEATVDHSSAISVAGWKKKTEEIAVTYNNSPLANRIKGSFTCETFLSALKGMNGDHANGEKSTAQGMLEWKKEVAMADLGKDALKGKTPSEVADYLASWKNKKIERVGGIDAWNRLSVKEQVEHDNVIVREIHKSLGQEAYDTLSSEDRRTLDFFLWAGCCMHKDQNSFKGGNTLMMAYWDASGTKAPVTLANKHNAALLQKTLDPSKRPSDLDETVLAALEASTRGGAKTAALAGVLLNNKDDKKGQGDSHVNHFKAKFGKDFRRFPDTSNTRFGSHGEAAGELLVHLEAYREFLRLVRDKKKKSGWTNLESNLYQALHDVPTLTELAAMALYTEAVSRPYMRSVRVSDGQNSNALELGNFHSEVCKFVEQFIEDPGLILDSEGSFCLGTLDGLEWERPEVIKAVRVLHATLPSLEPVFVQFLVGSLQTWIRFTAEFAPGGLIDKSTVEERASAWMPTTNDANEGILGALRVDWRDMPTLTLHQWNSMMMFSRNNTQSFMDRMLNVSDHRYIMHTARKIDASRLEETRRNAQVAFDLRLAEIRRQKDSEKARKRAQIVGRLSEIDIVTDAAVIAKMTVKKLDDQLDRLREIEKDLSIPKSKAARGKKADKQKLLHEALQRRALEPQVMQRHCDEEGAREEEEEIVDAWEDILDEDD